MNCNGNDERCYTNTVLVGEAPSIVCASFSTSNFDFFVVVVAVCLYMRTRVHVLFVSFVAAIQVMPLISSFGFNFVSTRFRKKKKKKKRAETISTEESE